MRGLVIPPVGPSYVKEFSSSNFLKEVQKEVQGYIEHIKFDEEVHAYCNEDGKMMCMINPLATKFCLKENLIFPDDYVCGTIVVFGTLSPEGEPTGEEYDVPSGFVFKYSMFETAKRK